MLRYLLIIGLILSSGVAGAQALVTLPTASSDTWGVTLTWDGPTSSPDPVAGYYAYRSPSGAYTFVNLTSTPLPLTPTKYIDTTVMAGTAYDYIVESVDAQGVTSAPSNIASVQMPPTEPVKGTSATLGIITSTS